MRYARTTVSTAALGYLDLGCSEDVDVYVGGLGSATTVAFAHVVQHSALVARRSILIDLLGSGWSDHDDEFSFSVEAHADAVAGVLDALHVSGVRLVGHSLGGSIAIALTSRRPDLVSDLVVAEPNLDPGPGSISEMISACSEASFVDSGHRDLVADLSAQGDAGDVNAAEFARTMRRWSPVALHRTAVSLQAHRTPTFRDQLTAIPHRRRYIAGTMSGEDLELIAAAGCTVRVVPDAGHVMMTDNLEGFVAALAPDEDAVLPTMRIPRQTTARSPAHRRDR